MTDTASAFSSERYLLRNPFSFPPRKIGIAMLAIKVKGININNIAVFIFISYSLPLFINTATMRKDIIIAAISGVIFFIFKFFHIF